MRKYICNQVLANINPKGTSKYLEDAWPALPYHLWILTGSWRVFKKYEKNVNRRPYFQTTGSGSITDGKKTSARV